MKIISLHPIFNENAYMLSEQLETEYLNTFEPIEDEIYLIYGAHEKSYELLQMQKKTKFKIIVMNSESYESNFFKNKYFLELMKNNIVLDYNNNKKQRNILNWENIKVLGYHWFNFTINEQSKNKDIDILFYGTPSQKRLNIYKTLINDFPDLNIMFIHNCFNNDLDDFIKRSRLVLNIPYYEHNILETHRINKELSYGCDVVSLTKKDYCYTDYIDFTDDITEYIKSYITVRRDCLTLSMEKPQKKMSYKDLQKKNNDNIIPQIKFIVKYYNLL